MPSNAPVIWHAISSDHGQEHTASSPASEFPFNPLFASAPRGPTPPSKQHPLSTPHSGKPGSIATRGFAPAGSSLLTSPGSLPVSPAKRSVAASGGGTVAGGLVASSGLTSPASPARSLRSSFSSAPRSPLVQHSSIESSTPPLSSTPTTPALPAKELPVLGLGLGVGHSPQFDNSTTTTGTNTPLLANAVAASPMMFAAAPPSAPSSPMYSHARPQPYYAHSSFFAPGSSASHAVGPGLTNITTSPSMLFSSPRNSATMTPTSSSGLPSPNFPPSRALPNVSQPPTPVVPPRNPARPPSASVSSTNSPSIFSQSNYNAPPSRRPSASSIVPPSPRMQSMLLQQQQQRRTSVAQGYGALSQSTMGPAGSRMSISRRNSRQVSVRLSSGFSSAVPSRSVSRVRTTTQRRRDSYSSPSAAAAAAVDVQPPAPGEVYVDTDVFARGDRIGVGLMVQGQRVRVTPSSASTSSSVSPEDDLSRSTFEVVRKLGSGSYAVVYLVREVLPPKSAMMVSRIKARRRMGMQVPLRGDVFDDDDGFGFSDEEDDDDEDDDELRYGREFAIKCLSKANLNAEELEIQMTEATIHQSLARHPNIVTLYATLETDAFLLLVLEYVPGEDLYYFLEQARDTTAPAVSDEDEEEAERGRKGHRSANSRGASAGGDEYAMAIGTTPTTPGLLASVQPDSLLSYRRLRLIARMFKQMCDAVQACHDQGVSHRDIKPENFIVSSLALDDIGDSRVLVKLSDFGLATTDRFSADVDCGSAPYMSYECRNNVGPTYATQSADVWSLGIVLINMLYHHNLWHDTHIGDASFEAFRAQPVTFLMQRSPGMTKVVAEFLADRVFRVLPVPPASEEAWSQYEQDVARTRVSAGDFGEWATDLPALFGTNGFTTSVSRRASAIASRNSTTPILEHSPDCEHRRSSEAIGNPADEVASEDDEEEYANETFRPDNTMIHGDLDVSYRQPGAQSPLPAEPMPLAQPVVDVPMTIPAEPHDAESSSPSTKEVCVACLDEQLSDLNVAATDGTHDIAENARTMSGQKRRKRGARKNKGLSGASVTSPASPGSSISSPLPSTARIPDELDELAYDTQSLARELSRQRAASTSTSLPPTARSSSRSRSRARTDTRAPCGQENEPPLVPSLPAKPAMGSLELESSLVPSKKPSKWNMFGRRENASMDAAPVSLPERAAQIVHSLDATYVSLPRHHADTVDDSPTSTLSTSPSTSGVSQIAFSPPPIPTMTPLTSPAPHGDDGPSWRGRRQEPRSAPSTRERWDQSPAASTYSARSNAAMASNWRQHPPPPASAASSLYNGSSGSSAASVISSAPSSTYTRFRNGSEYSVSTTATSISSASSTFNAGGLGGVLPRQKDKKSPYSSSASLSSTSSAPRSNNSKAPPRALPANVKRMDGVPWALDELPRQARPYVNGRLQQGDIFGEPPQRRRANKMSQPPTAGLGTISERDRERAWTGKSPLTRQASTSSGEGQFQPTSTAAADDLETQSIASKKVQKAQITGLAKLLTSFKTKGRDH